MVAQIPALADALHISSARIDPTQHLKLMELLLKGDRASERFMGILQGALRAELAGSPVAVNPGEHACARMHHLCMQ